MMHSLILDDYAMLLLERIMEMREIIAIEIQGSREQRFRPMTRVNKMIVEDLGEDLVEHVRILRFMQDIEPNRRGRWHVRIEASVLDYIEKLHQRSQRGEFYYLVDNNLEYGYNPAKIIEGYYWAQKPPIPWT